MTTLASASLSQGHQEHRARIVGPLTVSLGLGLATLTGTHMHIMTATLATVLEPKTWLSHRRNRVTL